MGTSAGVGGRREAELLLLEPAARCEAAEAGSCAPRCLPASPCPRAERGGLWASIVFLQDSVPREPFVEARGKFFFWGGGLGGDGNKKAINILMTIHHI